MPRYFWTLTAGLAGAALVWQAAAQSRNNTAQQTAIDADDIAGIVTSSKGAEAGIWVIAETTELPTKFRKIVVTDDKGRYLLPDLPAANYTIWTRGYGLVDSKKVQSKPGRRLNLTAVVAPDARRRRNTIRRTIGIR